MVSAIRSLYFQILMQDKDVQRRLKQISGQGDEVVRSFKNIDKISQQTHKNIALQTESLTRFFSQMDRAEKIAYRNQTLFGRGVNRLSSALEGLSASLGRTARQFSEFARQHKMAFAGLAASMSAIIGLTIQQASSYEESMVGIRHISKTTGRDLSKMLQIISNQTDALASKSAIASGMLKLMTTELRDDQLEQFIQVVKDGSAAMGEDFNTQLELVTRGFKQLNPNILDNIGINIRMDAIYKKAAKTYGVTQDKLTEAQIQQVLFNEMLRQGAKYAGAYEEKLKTTAGKMGQFRTNLENLGIAIGEIFLPALNKILTPINWFLDVLTKIPVVPTIIGIGLLSIAFIGLAGVIAGSVIPTVTSGAVALAGLLGAEIAATGGTVGLTTALAGLAAAIWAALAPLLPFIAAGAALVLVIQDIWTGLHGGKSVIFDLGRRLKGLLTSIPEIISGLWDKLKGLWSIFKKAGRMLIDAFLEGMTFGLVNTDRLASIFGKIREYLPFSDAKVGPLADLTLSGKKFIETFAKGAQMAVPSISLPLTNIMSMGAASTPAPINVSVSVNISDVHLSGDEKSLQRFGEVTQDAVEKALAKINRKQAMMAGWI